MKLKRIVLVGATVLFTAQPLVAQKWKDKLNAAKEKVNASMSGGTSNNKDYSADYEGVTFVDMMTHVDGWSDKKNVKHHFWSSRDNKYYRKDPVNIYVKKDGDSYKSFSIDNRKFAPITNDDSEKVIGFKGITSGRKLYLSEKTVVSYSTNNEGEIFIASVLGEKQPMKKLVAEIEAYQKYTSNIINKDVAAANAERKRIAEEKAAARKAKYGLHDKKIKSAKVIIKLPNENGNFMNVKFDIKTTLEDGTVISTADQGFYEDYEITKNYKTDFSGNLESGFIDGDAVKVTIVNKYNSKIKAEASEALSYNKGPAFLLYGRGWSGSAGDDGDDVEIEIKEEKHAVTGKPVLRVKLTSTAARAKLREFSLEPTASMIVKTYGGKGGKADGRSYDGGDGGDIIVYKDPSVQSFRIKYDVKGGAPGGISANYGRDGEYREIKQKVSF